MTRLRMTRRPDNRCGFPLDWPPVTLREVTVAVEAHNASAASASTAPTVRRAARPRVVSYLEGDTVVLDVG